MSGPGNNIYYTHVIQGMSGPGINILHTCNTRHEWTK